MSPEDAIAAVGSAGLRADAAVPIEGGWSSWTFELDGTWIVRFPRFPKIVRQQERERRILPALARHISFGVPAPDVVGEWSGSPFHVYSRIDGEPAQAGSVATDALAAVLREIHSFPVEEARTLLGDEGTVEAWRAEYAALREKVERDVSPLVDDAVQKDLAWAFDRFLGDPMAFEPAVVHRDLGLQHFLVGDGVVTGVIDWEFVGIGDPAIDFVGLWITLGSAATRDAVNAYGAVDQTFSHRIWFYRVMGAAHAVRYALFTDDDQMVQGAVAELARRVKVRARVCAAVIRDDRILMVHHRGQFWTSPGGGVEDGEALEDAVLRELAEETGLTGRVLRRLFEHPYASGESICFLVEAEGQVRPTGDEAVADVRWFPLAEKAQDIQVRHVIAALDQRDP